MNSAVLSLHYVTRVGKTEMLLAYLLIKIITTYGNIYSHLYLNWGSKIYHEETGTFLKSMSTGRDVYRIEEKKEMS